MSTGAQSAFTFRERGSTSSANDWIWYASGVGQAHVASLRFGFADRFSVDNLGNTTVTTLILNNVSSLGGGQQSLCRDNLNIVGDCSSSLRYKTNIAPLNTGLNFIKQLRPISFDWKAGGMHDVGFGAEDVAKIDPLFVTYNSKGEVEGVKYDRFSTVFVNAFNEQQTQIERQQEQIKTQQEAIKQQQTQVDALKKLVCSDHPSAEACKAR